MPYESASEITTIFSRMGIPLAVRDTNEKGKHVVATKDVRVGDGFEDEATIKEGRARGDAALFEESGIASWPSSELLAACARNRMLPASSLTDGVPELLVGYCEESLRLLYLPADSKAPEASITPVVVSQQNGASSGGASAPTVVYFHDQAALKRSVLAAVMLVPGLEPLRRFHSSVERRTKSTIPMSVESVTRCVVSAAVRFVKTLVASCRAHINAALENNKKLTTEAKKALLEKVINEMAEEKPLVTTPNQNISKFFEASVRPFNRLIEPPRGSAFEAPIDGKEWAAVVRSTIGQSVRHTVKKAVAVCLQQLSAGQVAVQPEEAFTIGEVPSGSPMLAVDVVIGGSLAANARSVTDATKTQEAVAFCENKGWLGWVDRVTDGWLSTDTLVTILGQLTLNAQALVAVSGLEHTPTSTLNDEAAITDKVVVPVTAANIQKEVPIFGAAIYTLQSCFNHSCTPNAEVLPSLPAGRGGHDIAVHCIPRRRRVPVAANKEGAESSSTPTESDVLLAAGEEVTITYIPELYLRLEGAEARQRRLASYFFECACPLCAEQLKK